MNEKDLLIRAKLIVYTTDLLAWLLEEHPKIIIEFSEARKETNEVQRME
jgi:hypothetical protein